MHITVVCPSCQTSYQLDAGMRGKRMRCPNNSCRQIFQVDGAAPEQQQRPAGQVSGSIGQVVPILTAESTAPVEPSPAPVSPWHQNPPGWRPQHPSARIILDAPPVEQEPLITEEEQPAASNWHATARSRSEEAPPPQPALPTAAPDWRSTPPPPRGGAAPPSLPRQAPPVQEPPRRASPPPRVEPARKPEPRPQPPRPAAPTMPQPILATVVENPPPPIELPPGAWETPPVRSSPAAVPGPQAGEPVHEMVATRKRRSLLMIFGVLAALLLVVGGVGGFVYYKVVTSEKHLAEQALEDYKAGLYANAESEYKELHKHFPESESAHEYAFMAELCDVRKTESDFALDTKKKMGLVATFLREHRKDPLMPDHFREVGLTYVKLEKGFWDSVPPKPDPSVQETVTVAKQTLDEFNGDLASGVLPKERAEIAQHFNEIHQRVDRELKRRTDVELVRQQTPTVEGIRKADEIIRSHGLSEDAEALAILEQLYKDHPRSITYTFLAAPPDPRGRWEDDDRSLLVDSLLHDPASTGGADEGGVVLALVRGVLYGLKQSSGAVQWAMRVGIDTTTLPVRVPATAFNPELILVLSADTSTLTALDAGGQQMWRYRLSAPCLGQPVVIKNHAYLPTFDGQIHEIELAKGLLLGRYTLGEREKLSVGGTHQPGTDLVYFPADEWCVFVLDVEKHVCEKILYTKHASGSLRGEPIISGWTEKDAAGQVMHQGYLFLILADELDSMRLRAYSLPIENPRADWLPMNPDPHMQGWAWFSPHQDAEKLILISDAGMLGLFGVKQKRNEDNPLFLLVPAEPGKKGLGYDLDLLLQPDAKRPGRSQVTYAAEENNFWVLAHGKLLRLHLLLTSRSGPRVLAAWPAPVNLGSPLHASQVFDFAFEQGGPKTTTLMLVTQPLARQTCLATAIDAETGTIRWQRQLGIVSRGEPLVLGQNVLALDQGGGLFSFDSAKFRSSGDQWSVGGRSLAPALDDGDSPPVLLPGPDGTTAYQFAIPATAKDKNPILIVRRYSDEGGPQPKIRQKEISLHARVWLAGTPAIGPSGILLPLSDGSILRLGLDGAKTGEGPNWRAGREDADLRTHIVWLNAEEFLTTDGGKHVFRWNWPVGKNNWDTVPQRQDNEPTLAMPSAIVTTPLALPAEPGNAAVRVLIAGADRVLYLVEGRDIAAVRKEGEKGVGLKIVKGRTWNLSGKISAGPFFLGKDSVGLIVDRNRLVRIDPAKPDLVWEYKSQGEAIVGQPQFIEDMLVVADQSGLFVGLDPDTGKPRGKGYKMRASVGPAASPVAFGAGQAFAPLTDGTVLLLSLTRLGEP